MIRSKNQGFTLMELLISVSIIGILGAVAYPSYINFVVRSDRSEALRELVRIANLQEQLYTDSRVYTTDMRLFGATTAAKLTTESSNYEISATVSGTTFVLTATAKSNQTKDTGCTALKITETGSKSPLSCWEI